MNTVRAVTGTAESSCKLQRSDISPRFMMQNMSKSMVKIGAPIFTMLLLIFCIMNRGEMSLLCNLQDDSAVPVTALTVFMGLLHFAQGKGLAGAHLEIAFIDQLGKGLQGCTGRSASHDGANAECLRFFLRWWPGDRD